MNKRFTRGPMSIKINIFKIFICVSSLFLLFFLTVWGGIGCVEALEINASDYPSLSDKEIGNLRWIIKLANQLPGDWSYMDKEIISYRSTWPNTDNKFRYQLAFMSYFLALAQYHKTPAYREVYQQAMDKLIQKMLRNEVWDYWYEVSKGGLQWNGQFSQEVGWIDPVVEKNVMYSGHLLHMIGLYKMLFRDMKYDKPGSITFTWDKVFPISKKKKFEYDHKSLAEVIHKQFVKNPLHVIECEPNAAFAACNQHPVLGLMLYDHTNGTNLSAVKELVRKTFYDRKFIDPKTHNVMDFYMVGQNMLVPVSSEFDFWTGWTGAFMHAWDPQFIEFHYPFQAQNIVKWNTDGTANPHSLSALFATLAKEVGDDKTAEGILAWFDKNFPSQWQDGMLCYLQKSDNKWWTPWRELHKAVARINVKNGLWTLHNRPWGDDHFVRPFINHVEYPKTIIKQSYYDPLKEALIVTLLAGTNDTRTTSFTVNNLDKSKLYSIKKDGETLGTLDKGILHLKSGVKEIEWRDDETLKISTDLLKSHTFLIYAK
jgi:hypothetical protein